jgi:hypothetical protein
MIKPVINQFNGGEVSPDLEGRFDWDKYNYSAKMCKNFIPLVEGNLKRRGGTHFVAKTEETPSFNVRFIFNFVDGKSQTVQATIDDTTIEVEEKEYETNVELGETLKYSFYANSYVSVNGEVYVDEDKEITIDFVNVNDAVNVTIITDPEDAVCFINGVETKSIVVSRNVEVNVEASYRNHVVTKTFEAKEDINETVVVDYIAYKSYRYEETEEINLNRGKYYVYAVGGSGGAGGGTYGDGRKSAGAGGGSGACYRGYINLEGKYTVNAGRWGKGGHSGRDEKDAADGGDGTATYISNVISLGGGTKGARGGGKGKPDFYGTGGKAIIYNSEAVLDKAFDGADAIGSKGGVSPTGNENYNGGSGVYKKIGNSGKGGYLVIRYKGVWK